MGISVGDHVLLWTEIICVLVWLYYGAKEEEARKAKEDKIRSFAKWALIALILFSTFLLSPYFKYQDAEAARKNAQAALDNKSPKLEGFINRIVPLDETFSTNSTIFLDVSVSNLGETPSDAEEYELKVILSTNASVTGEELKFTNEYTSSFVHKDQQWLLDLKRPQLIAEKTVSSIPNGEHRRGWLAFRLPGLKTGKYEMTNIIFSFADNRGNKIDVTNGFGWEGSPF